MEHDDGPRCDCMEQPRDIFDELDGVSLADPEKTLYRITAALDERRPARK